MKLNDAKGVADRCVSQPSCFSDNDLWTAYRRLLDTEKNGGVRNSERATRRLERRIAALEGEIKRRGMTDVPRLSALFPFGGTK